MGERWGRIEVGGDFMAVGRVLPLAVDNGTNPVLHFFLYYKLILTSPLSRSVVPDYL